MEHRNRYSARVAVQKNWSDEDRKNSKVKQEFGEKVDINNIMRKYNRTGVLPDMIKLNPRYGDFSSAQDYHRAMNIIVHSREQFEGLPADVRKRFNNDPEAFLAFAENPENIDQLVDMGLAHKKTPDAPEKPVKKKSDPPKAEKEDPPKPKVSEGEK